MFFPGLYEHFGERRDTVLVSFAAAHREGLHLLFTGSKVVPGLHVVETDIAFDPIPVGAFGVDGIVTPPHEVAHFVKQSGRHANPRGLGHAWSSVSRGVERFQAMISHMADLPETGPNIVLSGRFA